MRIQAPSSRATSRLRYAPLDVFFAALSPLLALYLRDAYILSHDGAVIAGLIDIFGKLDAETFLQGGRGAVFGREIETA